MQISSDGLSGILSRPIGFVKRHYQAVMRLGGGMLVAIGVLLVTGAWTDLTIKLQGWVSGFKTVI